MSIAQSYKFQESCFTDQDLVVKHQKRVFDAQEDVEELLKEDPEHKAALCYKKEHERLSKVYKGSPLFDVEDQNRV